MLTTHFQSLRTLLHFNHHMLHRLVDALPESALEGPMVPGANSGRWVLIHLAVSLDLALLTLGRPTLLPRELVAAYAPRSSGEVGADAPTPAAAIEMIDTAVENIDAALAELAVETDPEELETIATRLQRPHRAEPLQGTPINTIGDAFAHLVTTHFATHLGQLSLVRRAAGLRPVI